MPSTYAERVSQMSSFDGQTLPDSYKMFIVKNFQVKLILHEPETLVYCVSSSSSRPSNLSENSLQRESKRLKARIIKLERTRFYVQQCISHDPSHIQNQLERLRDDGEAQKQGLTNRTTTTMSWHDKSSDSTQTEVSSFSFESLSNIQQNQPLAENLQFT